MSTPDVHAKVLESELAAVRGELARIDHKCATLVALSGVVMAVVIPQIGRVSDSHVRTVMGVGVLVLAIAAVVMLVAILRPRLGTSGFQRWSAMTPRQIERMFTVGYHDPNPGTVHDRVQVSSLQPADLHFLSALVAKKQGWLRHAIDFMVGGLVLIGIAPVVGGWLA